MKIAVLMENTACREGFLAEHGLSLYIETGSRRLLFDTGQTDGFLRNAQKLGIDLSGVDTAVLSHGHYDHGGGLPAFLERNQKAPVYLSPLALEPHYHGPERYIGLPHALKACGRLTLVEDRMDLGDGIALETCLRREETAGDQGLQVLRNGVLLPEDFRHEIYLTIREQGTLYLFSGCSHRGAVNIAGWFRPDVFIGGFHLSKIQDDGVLMTAAEALAVGQTRYYTGHCTGQRQFEVLHSVLGSRLTALSAGMTLEL